MNETIIREAMAQAIEEGVFPSATLLVAKRENILFRELFGAAKEDTIFDIASLTKPISAATLAMLTVKEKKLSLNTALSKYFSDFEEEDKKKITIRHLLRHTSGLPPWKSYFKEIKEKYPELLGTEKTKPLYLAKISQEPLVMPVAYQKNYSDLGFILLGLFLEKYWGESLEKLFLEKVATPLELKRTFYNQIGNVRSEYNYAPTENSEWRGKLICGEVHDDNAYAMGGVAGHAGLFSHMDDIHQFLCLYNRALEGRFPYLSEEYTLEFIGPAIKVKLGWDMPSYKDSQSGQYFSKNSVGHLGYTGCSFWIDFDQEFHVILLTNRVHPTSENEKIKVFRPKIHDLIYENLIKG